MIWYEVATMQIAARAVDANGETILYHCLHLKIYYRQTFKLAKSRMLRLILLELVARTAFAAYLTGNSQP